MSTRVRISLLAVLVCAWAGSAAGERCTTAACARYPIIWEHDTFRGKCLRLPVHARGLKAYDFNDVASSVCVPKGWRIRLYEHTAFEGRYLELRGPIRIADLKRERPDGVNWGDRISSIEVLKKP